MFWLYNSDYMTEFHWDTASEEEIKAYLDQKDKKTAHFLESLEAPLGNLTVPQEGEAFDNIADQIEKAAPNSESVFQGIRMFGRRNSQLRREAENKFNTP